MKRTRITGMLSGLGLVLMGWTGGARRTPAQQAPPSAASPVAAQTVSKEPSKQEIQEINDGFVQKITRQITGHEQEPAEKVFKNVQIMKTVPAARFLLIMNLGYARGLGVACTHCHDEKDFSNDEKRPKRAAREMAVMHRSINDQITKMQNLEPNPNGHFINCSTCHRGQIDPMAEAK